MNKKTIQTVLVAFGIAALLILGDLLLKKMPEKFQQTIDLLQLYALWILLLIIGIGSIIFLFYNLFREFYIETILQRADKLLETSLDTKGEYLYIAAACYQSGDESGPGYYIYRYYLFELTTGNKRVFKAKGTKEDPKGAFHYFNSIIKKPFLISQRGIANQRLEKEEYIIRIHSFKKRFDEGFEITCHHKVENKLKWQKKI